MRDQDPDTLLRQRSTISRAAVTDMPLVDITAQSNRSGMRAFRSSGSKPSFSM